MKIVHMNPEWRKEKGGDEPPTVGNKEKGRIGKIVKLNFSSSNKQDKIGKVMEKIYEIMEKTGQPLSENFKMSVLSRWIFQHEGVHKGEAYKQFLIGFQQEERARLLERLNVFKPNSEIAQSVSGVSYYLALYDALC